MCQDTIHKYFRKAGVLKDGASALPDSADPLDDDLDLISKVHRGTES